jgi:imidazolonepropionase-like amidohydrolase
MAVAGGAGAGAEIRWGEKWLGTNGKRYEKFWANGYGRTFRIASLTRALSLYTYAAGTWDLDELGSKNITLTQFYLNLGLLTLS